jgi:uncharacterized protein (DUF1499 family)
MIVSSGRTRVFAAVTAMLVLAVVSGCATRQGGAEGMEPRFAPCPNTPNCVSSYQTDDVHGIEPLPLPDGDAVAVLRSVVESFPRTRIVVADGDYVHATFTSLVFRFVDDVEFRVDRDAGVVHVRSASRVGAGDLGVNRKRVEEIRSLLNERR